MDAVTLGMANASLRRAADAPGKLMSVLRRNRENAVLAILGDSTGNATDEWVYMLVQWLASEFPTHTVNYYLWNDATQAYGTVTVLQTGTGSRTLTVYNGSHPGAGYEYPYQNSNSTRFAAMIPVTPTAVISSFGYNNGQSTYRIEMFDHSRWVLGKFPETEFIVCAQPPKATADADSANSILRSGDVRNLATQEGWGLIDAAQVFLDHGNFDTLILGDNIHPNLQGQTMWFNEAKRYFQRTARVKPKTSGARFDRFFIPAAQFTPLDGTPTITASAVGLPKYDFDATTPESVVGIIDIPPTWATFNIWLVWSTAGGSTNSLVWYVDYVPLTGQVQAIVSGSQPSGFTAGSKQTFASVNTAGNVRAHRVLGPSRVTGGRPLVFKVRRDPADASDTFAADAWFFGLWVERAS